MFEKIARLRKAVVAAVTPALAILAEFVGVDSPWYVKVVSFLVAVGVYTVPNRPAPPEVVVVHEPPVV